MEKFHINGGGRKLKKAQIQEQHINSFIDRVGVYSPPSLLHNKTYASLRMETPPLKSRITREVP